MSVYLKLFWNNFYYLRYFINKFYDMLSRFYLRLIFIIIVDNNINFLI